MLMKRKCKFCGKQFEAHCNRQIYCNDPECRTKRLRTKASDYYYSTGRYNLQKLKVEKSFVVKEKLTLAEKEKYCRELGLSYGEMQQLVDSYDSRERIIAKLESIRRQNFTKESQRNAEEINVYQSYIGNQHSKGMRKRYE